MLPTGLVTYKIDLIRNIAMKYIMKCTNMNLLVSISSIGLIQCSMKHNFKSHVCFLI